MWRRWKNLSIAVRVTLVYVVVGVAWIYYSDSFVAQLPGIISEQINRFQNLKGSFFVLATGAILLTYLTRKEKTLRYSEKRYRLIADNASDIVYLYRFTDPVGYEYISPSCLAITGFTQEEHYADPEIAFKLVHPEDRSEFERMLRGEVDLSQPLQLRWRRKDGSFYWSEVRNTPELGPNGELISLLGIVRDITDRKTAEIELHKRERYLASMIEASPIVIITIDEHGDVHTWNPEAERVFGWRRSEVVGQQIPGQPDGELEQLFGPVMDGKPIALGGRHWRRENGEEVILDIAASPLFNDKSQVAGTLLMMLDVSERVKAEKKNRLLEDELRQALKMEAIGRLAGGVAHDFNNMLAVIMSTTELLMADLDPESEIFEDLKHIDNAASRSAELTRQLLAFSRKQVVQPTAVNMNKVIREQERMLSRMIGEEIQVRLKLSEDLWEVFIDPSQVNQILANLTVNARDAIRGVGTLTIETANVELNEEYSRHDMPVGQIEYAMLAVADTGAGIPADVLEHIFEPFFTTKSKEQGTGLGLSTIYGIVKQNSGVIHVYSEPGMGTTFKVFFPRYTGEGETTKKSEALMELGGEETILVVEDEVSILKLTQRFLESLGYQVLAANTPLEALKVVLDKGHKIDLLLSDVVMPEMNGRQLEEKVRELAPSISCLFMSGYTADVIAQRGVLDENVNFISKPFTMTTLATKVREVLDRN